MQSRKTVNMYSAPFHVHLCLLGGGVHITVRFLFIATDEKQLVKYLVDPNIWDTGTSETPVPEPAKRILVFYKTYRIKPMSD